MVAAHEEEKEDAESSTKKKLLKESLKLSIGFFIALRLSTLSQRAQYTPLEFNNSEKTIDKKASFQYTFIKNILFMHSNRVLITRDDDDTSEFAEFFSIFRYRSIARIALESVFHFFTV